jgi:hypothetical protein
MFRVTEGIKTANHENWQLGWKCPHGSHKIPVLKQIRKIINSPTRQNEHKKYANIL